MVDKTTCLSFLKQCKAINQFKAVVQLHCYIVRCTTNSFDIVVQLDIKFKKSSRLDSRVPSGLPNYESKHNRPSTADAGSRADRQIDGG